MIPSPTPIDYRLIFALIHGKVSHILRRTLNTDFQKAGIELTGDQWDVLMAITTHDICTQQDLCYDTSFSKPTMSRIINSLEEQKIVIRRKARVDYRNNYITITRKGQELAERAQAIAVRTLKESLRGLSKSDIITSQQSLNTVLHNLQEKEKRLALELSEEQHRLSEKHKRDVRRMHNI